MVSGRVGYFELEQCLQEDGVRLEAVGSSPGPGITLKVYGDVWRWLSDGRVLSLGEKVVEVQFSYVHVDRLAKKATAVAQVGEDVDGRIFSAKKADSRNVAESRRDFTMTHFMSCCSMKSKRNPW